MSYWKLLGIILAAVVLDCGLAFILAFMLFKLGLASGESFIGYLLIFVALGMLTVSVYEFKKGVIFSWWHQPFRLFYKPSRDFYLKLWYQLTVFVAILLIGLYGVIVSYLK